MKQYCYKKPEIVEAILWTGVIDDEIETFMGCCHTLACSGWGEGKRILVVDIGDILIGVTPGSYIIKDGEGNFSVDGPAAFSQDYIVVKTTSPAPQSSPSFHHKWVISHASPLSDTYINFNKETSK